MRIIASFMASALALLLVLITGSSSFAQGTTTFAQRPAADQKVTIVGCVERADQVLAREDLGTTVDSLSFVLIKAEDAAAPRNKSNSARSSAAAGDADKTAGKTYRLGAAIDTLNPHVGHKVEITGAMAPVGTSGSNGGVAGVGVPPLIRVDSVKMLSLTCGR
jgi:hypothetical protein